MLLFALLACSDQGFTVNREQEEVAPRLVISPDTVDFGFAGFGERKVKSVTLTNEGNALLDVDAMTVAEGTGVFTIVGGSPAPFSLSPGEATEVVLGFTPVVDAHAGRLRVDSTDPASPEAWVDLRGVGAFPLLEVRPPELEFGRVDLECDDFLTETRQVELRNVGEVDVVVEDMVLLADASFLVEASLPFLLPPHQKAFVPVRWAPAVPGSYAGTLEVSADGLAEPAVLSVSGEVVSGGEVVDTWVQPPPPAGGELDVLLHLDQSCSMLDELWDIADGIGSLFDALTAFGADWRIGALSAATSCVTGEVIDASHPDPLDAFIRVIISGFGKANEKALGNFSAALDLTGPGQCNEGLLREASTVQLLALGDEVEQSVGTWADHVERYQAFRPGTVLSAIVGDVPLGCSGADPGWGYYEATVATGGSFVSICTKDWGAALSDLGQELATGLRDTFALSQEPWVETIEVDVDGVGSTAWEFVSTSNAVVFEPGSVPGHGSTIEVRYIRDDCPR